MFVFLEELGNGEEAKSFVFEFDDKWLDGIDAGLVNVVKEDDVAIFYSADVGEDFFSISVLSVSGVYIS